MPFNWTVYRLPRSHWHCALENFDWALVTPKSLQSDVDAFCAQVREGGDPHLLLTGGPGIGKSHLGVASYRTLAGGYGTDLCSWCNVPAFCDAVKTSYTPDLGDDPWPDIEGAKRLVVLDDLFGRDYSSHEASQIVYRLIDVAYTNAAGVVVTMNREPQELSALLRGHELSRLLSKHTMIGMAAKKDYRRAQA